jgi:hypothetical protein
MTDYKHLELLSHIQKRTKCKSILVATLNEELIQAVTEGKKFRIVGDNVNFMITASHQRKGNNAHRTLVCLSSN